MARSLFNITKDKEDSGNCHRLKEIKETQQLNAVWDTGLNPGIEDGH